MFQLYTMTTIPSGSIANNYCPLNHNSPIATPECKELGNIYSMDKPPLLYLRVFRRLSETHTTFALCYLLFLWRKQR